MSPRLLYLLDAWRHPAKAEFVSSLPERAQAMADQMWSSRVDQDGDGFVTKEQFLALRMGPAGGGGGK